MIDTNLINEENGFIKGCMIEINGSVLTYDGFYKYSENYAKAIWTEEGGGFVPSKIKSLRFLTGDLAVWNFAPKGKSVLVKNPTGWYWLNSVPEKLSQEDEVSFRPFWAK